MRKVTKLKGIVSRPLRVRYLMATGEEREALRPVLEEESRRMIEKMGRKGYQLEAKVAGVFGLFTRGAAQGTVELVAEGTREAAAP